MTEPTWLVAGFAVTVAFGWLLLPERRDPLVERPRLLEGNHE